MRRVVLDVETYWDSEYSLSKMPIELYVNDSRFKVHGWGVAEIGKAPMWLSPLEFDIWVTAQDWSQTAVIGHNLHFDGYILSKRYGIRPRLWIDTLGMSRAIYPWYASHALGVMAVNLDLGHKDGDVLQRTKGKRELAPYEFAEMGEYCKIDCELTAKLYAKMADVFPREEYKLSDITVRMFTEPSFTFDVPRLKTFLAAYQQKLDKLIASASVDKSVIQSNAKFAAALARLGVPLPRKISKTTGKPTYAFAKNDPGLLALLGHEDPRVVALVAARIGTKSSIIGTRAERFIQMGNRLDLIPIHLNYWGARVTGRHSGGGGTNFQNLPRRGDGKELRNCLRAPPGFKVVVGDSSNIELRMVMKLSGQEDVVEKLYRKEDLYCDFASRLYGRTITKADVNERFVGKVGMLSLQYGAGDERFLEMLLKEGVKADRDEAIRIKDMYRSTYSRVPALWWYCGDDVLKAIHNGMICVPVDVNGWFLTNPTGFGLPGKLGVQYKGLTINQNTNTYAYISGRIAQNKIYGAKVVENLCQHAARQVIAHQALLFSTRYKLANTVHDELVAVVKEDEAEECAAFMLQCLQTPPKWCTGVPLAGEVHIGDSYGEAK